MEKNAHRAVQTVRKLNNHHAVLAKSPRLQRIWRILSDRGWHSTMEIQNRAVVCAVGSCISELRTNGLMIEQRYTYSKGVKKSEYKLSGSLL